MIGVGVSAIGAEPVLGEFPGPSASSGGVVVDVLAAGINPSDRMRRDEGPHPRVLGNEGVGLLAGRGRVYFERTLAPFGSFAEQALTDPALAIQLPDDVSAGQALGIGIAGLAAWLSLSWRAGLRPGERVLVLGASGSVGQIAVQAARLLGAGHVVAAARDVAAVPSADGQRPDAMVELVGDYSATLREASGDGFDVVIDPLFGEPLATSLAATAPGCRVVSVGASAGATVALDQSALMGRSLLTYANRATPPDVKRAAYKRMLSHVRAGELVVASEEIPLLKFAEAWRVQAESPHRKLVLIPPRT